MKAGGDRELSEPLGMITVDDICAWGNSKPIPKVFPPGYLSNQSTYTSLNQVQDMSAEPEHLVNMWNKFYGSRESTRCFRCPPHDRKGGTCLRIEGTRPRIGYL